MDTISTKTWFVGLASLFPGVGFFLLKKQNWGSITMAGTAILFAVFFFYPSLFTWYLFAVPYTAQMAYSVALAALSNTSNNLETHQSISGSIPAKYLDRKNGSHEIRDMLEKTLQNGENVESATIGVTKKQLLVVGLTNSALYIAEYVPDRIQNINRYSIESIQWTVLHEGESESLLSIEIENGEKVELTIPIQMAVQAHKVIEPFPGTLEREKSGVNIWNYIKERNRIRINISGLVGSGIMLVGIFLSGSAGTPTISLGIFATFFGIGLFMIPWSSFVMTLRRINQEHGMTTNKVLGYFSILGLAFVWGWSLYFLGAISISLILAMRMI